jgi:hypothetical protein
MGKDQGLQALLANGRSSYTILETKPLTTYQRPAGDAQREYEAAWGSDPEEDEKADASDGSDDSDGDNTII